MRYSLMVLVLLWLTSPTVAQEECVWCEHLPASQQCGLTDVDGEQMSSDAQTIVSDCQALYDEVDGYTVSFSAAAIRSQVSDCQENHDHISLSDAEDMDDLETEASDALSNCSANELWMLNELNAPDTGLIDYSQTIIDAVDARRYCVAEGNLSVMFDTECSFLGWHYDWEDSIGVFETNWQSIDAIMVNCCDEYVSEF